ncbi:MAG: metallophosphoesterase family protein [Solirubrobacterales bacterium]|nr:metallophosphoesterase family protein [Solirubrobacterales bacterium]
MTRLAIISDTHLPRGQRRLPEACLERLRAADLILHGGDLITAAFLDELEAIGPPVRAVLGNVDEPALAARLPHARVVEVDGVRIGMVHDAGPARGRLERQRARFADCAAVVFGHSHIPLSERTEDGSFQIFNPGSPTDRRRQRVHTMGDGVVERGEVEFALVIL